MERIFFATLFLCVPCFGSQHTHLQKNVTISDYKGPCDKEMFSLFRGAEELYMINSEVTRVTAHLYGTFTNLKKIYLENDTFYYVDPDDTMKDARTLEEFYYINISWPHFDLKVWRNIPKLKKLIIRDMVFPVKKVHGNSLVGSPLEILEISNSSLEKIKDSGFNGLDKLEILNLTNNKLTTISKEVLTPLVSLKVLDLSGNKLESFGVENIPSLPHLEELYLDSVEGASFAGIKKVAPNLKHIHTSDKTISGAELDALNEGKPIAVE